MKPVIFEIRECDNPACALRYPIKKGHAFGDRCPACLGETRVVLSHHAGEMPKIREPNRNSISVECLLDNVRSALNVGAIFRTAEGFGVSRLHLCGITPTPETAKINKTALGSEKIIPWSYHKNSVLNGKNLKREGCSLWALERTAASKPIMAIKTKYISKLKTVVLIAGNEEAGVDPDLLAVCDEVLHIPMAGTKESFNVSVALGTALGIIQYILFSK